ncbi:MAG: hypothetical protein Q8L29_02495 [archaeon]|nr:hypothetical protein [archaeon]
MNNYYNMDGMHHTMNLNNMDHNSYSSTHNRYSSMHYSPNLMQNKINMGWLQ